VVVGVVGRKRSGKDTFTKYCVEALRHRRVAVTRFALPLKEMVLAGLGLPLRAVVDDEWVKQGSEPVSLDKLHRVVYYTTRYLQRHRLPGLEPNEVADILRQTGRPLGDVYRFLLKYLGTEVVRTRDDLHWVTLTDNAIRALLKDHDDVFVPDVRFPNEANLIRSYKDSVLVRTINLNLNDQDTHPSEVFTDTLDVDWEIKASSVKELQDAAYRFVQKYWP